MSISWVHKVGYEVMPDDVLDDVPHRRRLPKRGAARRPSSSMSIEQLVGLAPSTLPTLKAIAGRFFSGGGSKERCE